MEYVEISKCLEEVFLDFPGHCSRRRKKKNSGKAHWPGVWMLILKQLLCPIRDTNMLPYLLLKNRNLSTAISTCLLRRSMLRNNISVSLDSSVSDSLVFYAWRWYVLKDISLRVRQDLTSVVSLQLQPRRPCWRLWWEKEALYKLGGFFFELQRPQPESACQQSVWVPGLTHWRTGARGNQRLRPPGKVVWNVINTLDFWVWSFSHSIFWLYDRIISQTVCLPHGATAVHQGSKRVLQDLACGNCYVKSLMAPLALRNGIFGEHTAQHQIFYHVKPQSGYAEELESLW